MYNVRNKENGSIETWLTSDITFVTDLTDVRVCVCVTTIVIDGSDRMRKGYLLRSLTTGLNADMAAAEMDFGLVGRSSGTR